MEAEDVAELEITACVDYAHDDSQLLRREVVLAQLGADDAKALQFDLVWKHRPVLLMPRRPDHICVRSRGA